MTLEVGFPPQTRQINYFSLVYPDAMSRLHSLVYLLVALSVSVSASIGPIVPELEIVNKEIAPDGFLRQ